MGVYVYSMGVYVYYHFGRITGTMNNTQLLLLNQVTVPDNTFFRAIQGCNIRD